MSRVNLCTYFDFAYSTKGMALYKSLLKHVPDFKLYVLALDDEAFYKFDKLPGVSVVHIDMWITDSLREARKTKDKAGSIWMLTPFWTTWCLYQELDMAYIDSDCYFFSNPILLYEEVSRSDIAIVPHRFDINAKFREEMNGKYNVGWVYFKNTPVAMRCLSRWSEQCMAWCFHKSEDGKMGDQKFLDSWPEEYNAHVVRNISVDIAPWNQEQYKYTLNDGSIFVSDGERTDQLCLYHFHEHVSKDQRTYWKLHPFIEEHVYPIYEKEIDGILGQ